jgi:hypothetical protein
MAAIDGPFPVYMREPAAGADPRPSTQVSVFEIVLHCRLLRRREWSVPMAAKCRGPQHSTRFPPVEHRIIDPTSPIPSSMFDGPEQLLLTLSPETKYLRCLIVG